VNDDRWRRASIVLGSALVLEGWLGFMLRLSTLWDDKRHPEPLYLAVLTEAIPPAVLGLLLLVSVWKPRFIPRATRAGFSTIVALIVPSFFAQFLYWGHGSGLFLFSPLASIVTTLGVPFLWASAILRTEHPGDAGLQKVGRIGAGLVQLGFVLQFVALAGYWRTFGYEEGRMTLAGVLFSLASVMEIGESLLLLWASVQSVRTAPEDAVIQDRAVKIHRLMKIWVLVSLATGLLHALSFSELKFQDMGVDVWNLALGTTVQLATTFALAREYLLQFGATVPPMARSEA
jgi:hypothetical protein